MWWGGERAGNLEGALQMLYDGTSTVGLRRRILDCLSNPVTLLALSAFFIG
jgi:hypothetical protein